MRIPSSFVAAVGLSSVALLSSGCGGGGGGGSSPAPVIPGTLAAVAVEGGLTAAAGNYGPFVPDMLLSAAQGGWVAFVADVIGGTAAKGLFVEQPNGVVVVVYKLNETIVSPGTGTISAFRRIWMRPGGIVVADVDLTGGALRAIIAARADGLGGVVEKATVFYKGEVMPLNNQSHTAGALVDIEEDVTEVAENGRVFIHGIGTTLEGIYAAQRVGGAVGVFAVGTDVVPTNNYRFGNDFSAIACNSTGVVAAFACDLTAGTGGAEGIFATSDGVNWVTVADQDPAVFAPNSGGRAFANVFDGQRLHLTFPGPGQPGFVTWRGTVTGASFTHGLYRRQVVDNSGSTMTLGILNSVIGAGETLFSVGAGASSADEVVYDQEMSPNAVIFRTDVAGGNTAHVFARVAPLNGNIFEAFRQGTIAPGGSTFGTGYPSLGTTKRNDCADISGSFAFTAVLADASNGVFWDIFGGSRFAIAKQTNNAPGTGGGLFGSFATPSAVSTAAGTVAFRAAIVGGSGATGIFRQY
jgi:hypothetical protein